MIVNKLVPTIVSDCQERMRPLPHPVKYIFNRTMEESNFVFIVVIQQIGWRHNMVSFSIDTQHQICY